LRHGRIIDRLDVDAILLEQEIARRLALLGIADEHRHDVGVVHHHGRPAASSTALVRAAQLASLSVSSVRGRPIPRGEGPAAGKPGVGTRGVGGVPGAKYSRSCLPRKADWYATRSVAASEVIQILANRGDAQTCRHRR